MFHFAITTRVVSLGVLLGALSIQGSTALAERPNIVLIVSDDQRSDTIAALGNSAIDTPNLDRLVARGTVFRNMTCANPICTPSRAELLTGCSGFRNGTLDFGGTVKPELTKLPEPFRDVGYETWYCGKWHNKGRPADYGYQQTRRLFTGGGGKWATPQVDYRGHPVTGYRGWIFRDSDDQPLPDLGVGLSPETSRLIADGAIDSIESSSLPFFVHVNFSAPHDPLMPTSPMASRYRDREIPLPGNFAADHPFDHGNRGGRDENLLPIPRTRKRVRDDLAAYYAVISDMDQQIGRILQTIEAKGVTDSTIVVFTSDHGLAMGSHGLRGKQNMYDHTIEVPFVIAGPGIPEGKTVDGLGYLRDIMPTLCDLAELKFPDVDGRSQVSVINGETDSVYGHVVGYFRDSQRMIRTPRWKLIRYPLVDEVQLFDLQSDPLEMHDLAEDPAHADRVKRLRKRLADSIPAE